jgi:hypothetical protein
MVAHDAFADQHQIQKWSHMRNKKNPNNTYIVNPKPLNKTLLELLLLQQ